MRSSSRMTSEPSVRSFSSYSSRASFTASSATSPELFTSSMSGSVIRVG